jgi:hypothetical protein
MARLFSYRIPVDDGAAPNPFWGRCTLVICKPKLRRAAAIDDWIVATGSKNSPVGDKSAHLVYAMQVAKKLTMQEYDDYARAQLPEKIPDIRHRDPRRRLGDAIYDFARMPPTLRPGVHTEDNRATDLRGEFALIADEFCYFGKLAVPLPDALKPIVKEGQGHRSTSNDRYLGLFLDWFTTQPRGIVGEPQLWADRDDGMIDRSCGTCRRADDEEDEERDDCA